MYGLDDGTGVGEGRAVGFRDVQLPPANDEGEQQNNLPSAPSIEWVLSNHSSHHLVSSLRYKTVFICFVLFRWSLRV